MREQLQANIRKFIAFNIFSSFVLYYGVDKVFMAARGLSTTEMVWLEVIGAALILLLEVPSGALSDRWSRKYVLALNVAFFITNTCCWALAQDLSLFLIGTTAASIHMALRSGTDTSFLYDTLDQLGRTNEYEKILGRSIFWENLFAIPAGLVGPILAHHFGLEAPFWLTLPFSLAALFIALSFAEPKIHRSSGETHFFEHIAASGRFLWRHPRILHVMGVGIVLSVGLVLLDEYAQLYFVYIGLPVFTLGFLAAAGHLIEALAGRLAARLKDIAHQKVHLMALLMSILGFVGVGLSSNSLVGLAFVFLPWIAYYAVKPLLLGTLHRTLPTEQRATAESFMSLLGQVAFIPVAFIFSAIADSAPIATAFGALGVLISLYLGFYLLSSRKAIGKIV